MKELEQIISAYALANSKQQKAALATVVHVEGSSYRGPGARMLITEEGVLTGAISGGCLEGDALRKALMVMIEGKPLLTTYDTSDEEDAVIGIGLGCNGIISILIEPILVNASINPIELLKSIVEKRQPSVLVTLFSQDNKRSLEQGTRLLMREDGELAMDVSAPYANAALQDVKGVMHERLSSFISYPVSSGEQDGVMKAFMEYVLPPISLVVAGAGNDVIPLVHIAAVLGWRVTLIDGRVNYANDQRFPACSVIVTEPEEALERVSIDKNTAVVLMTHNYQYDKVMLSGLLKLAVPYIGMLGPKKKLNRMLMDLANEGMAPTEEELLRVHSPVGLDIGAETPDEIALAIAAEIKAVFAGNTGIPLRDRVGDIQDRKKTISK